MVPSMGTMERLYSPKINNVAVVFNFNTIFYVWSRSEEISPIIERCSEAPYELVYLNNDRQASPHPQVPSQLLAELPLHVAAHWDQVDHLDQSATTAL